MNGMEVFFKYAMCIVNGIYVFKGIITILLGAYLVIATQQFEALNNTFFFYLGIFIVLIGIFVTVHYFLGCWGLKSENPHMLFTFAGLLTLVFLAEVSLIGSALVVERHIPELVNTTAYKTFEDTYSPNAVPDHRLTDLWNNMQEQLHCCGVNGYADYSELSTDTTTVSVPSACCSDYTDLPCDTTVPSRIFAGGCAPKISDIIEMATSAYIQWGLVFSVLQLAWIGGSLYFAIKFRRARRSQSYETLINPPPYPCK